MPEVPEPDNWDSDHCCCEQHKMSEPHQIVDAAAYFRCLHCNEFFFPEELKRIKYIMVN